MSNWKFVQSSDPQLEDDMYVNTANPKLHIQVCFDGTFSVGKELEDNKFMFRDEFKSLKAAQQFAESWV